MEHGLEDEGLARGLVSHKTDLREVDDLAYVGGPEAVDGCRGESWLPSWARRAQHSQSGDLKVGFSHCDSRKLRKG